MFGEGSLALNMKSVTCLWHLTLETVLWTYKLLPGALLFTLLVINLSRWWFANYNIFVILRSILMLTVLMKSAKVFRFASDVSRLILGTRYFRILQNSHGRYIFWKFFHSAFKQSDRGETFLTRHCLKGGIKSITTMAVNSCKNCQSFTGHTPFLLYSLS